MFYQKLLLVKQLSHWKETKMGDVATWQEVGTIQKSFGWLPSRALKWEAPTMKFGEHPFARLLPNLAGGPPCVSLFWAAHGHTTRRVGAAGGQLAD